MASMADQAVRSFLGAGTRTGKLAVVRRDGRPMVAPIWFVLDGDDLVFTTGADTVKGRAIRRDPRLSLCVDEERPPYAYVRVDGTAEVSEDADEMLVWATRIASRYMGEAKADAFGRRNAVPGELLVRLRAERVVVETDVADEPAR